MGHHALGVDPRQALTGSRMSAGQSHFNVTRSKELWPTALAGLFFRPDHLFNDASWPVSAHAAHCLIEEQVLKRSRICSNWNLQCSHEPG